MLVIKNTYGRTVETEYGTFAYRKSTVKKMIKAGYTFWVPDGDTNRKLKQKEILNMAKED